MDRNWNCWMGDFALLRDSLSKRKVSCAWVIIGMIDSLARGVGQVLFANNTISGALIIISLASVCPKNLLAGLLTGLLGLLVSMLTEDHLGAVENGLTIYNPFLIGCVTYAVFPGSWNGFSVLLTTISAIASVYLTMAMTNKRFPCVTVPFNVIETILLIVLTTAGEQGMVETPVQTANATNAMEVGNEVVRANVTHLEWGLAFRGIVASSSQIFAVDNVPVGAVTYLAILIYSPTTAAFSLAGAVIGCFTAFGLDIPHESIYSGLWGYNSLLSSASLGGLFLVLNKQTVPLAFIAAVFTVLLQYVLQPVFTRFQLPILTIPFVMTFRLFVGIRGTKVFPQPETVTFPEEQRFNFLSASRRVCDVNPTGSTPEQGKFTTIDDTISV